MTPPSDFITPREAVAAMVAAGAVFSVRRRDDGLGMTFSYHVADGGDAQRYRDISGAVKGKPTPFIQALLAAVQASLCAYELEGVVETTPSVSVVVTTPILAAEGDAETPPSRGVVLTTPSSGCDRSRCRMSSALPKPLCASDVDLRDMPIPRETFAQMAVDQFGLTIEEARAHVNQVADQMEGRRSSRRRR